MQEMHTAYFLIWMKISTTQIDVKGRKKSEGMQWAEKCPPQRRPCPNPWNLMWQKGIKTTARIKVIDPLTLR